MENKNIFFGLCISMVFVSEIVAMQLVTKRVPKSMYRAKIMNPTLSKQYAQPSNRRRDDKDNKNKKDPFAGDVAVMVGSYIVADRIANSLERSSRSSHTSTTDNDSDSSSDNGSSSDSNNE